MTPSVLRISPPPWFALLALLELSSCAARPQPCAPLSVSLPLLGVPGDSPILPVRVQDRDAAMFFSPGFGPLLLRDNGSLLFPRYHRIDLRRQDGDDSSADTSFAVGLSVGTLQPATRQGLLLPEPDDHRVGGRPIVGMLGREILPEDALVRLDIPGRHVVISTSCPDTTRPAVPESVAMQQDVLLVPVRINGAMLQAVLEPDLPISILPEDIADRIGLDRATLADDPSVVTKFGRGVLGRRHRIQTLAIGDALLRNVAFDVEADMRYPMLGLNVFALGRAIFDFKNGAFLFRQTTDILPAATSLHFDRTRVAHTNVGE